MKKKKEYVFKKKVEQKLDENEKLILFYKSRLKLFKLLSKACVPLIFFLLVNLGLTFIKFGGDGGPISFLFGTIGSFNQRLTYLIILGIITCVFLILYDSFTNEEKKYEQLLKELK